MRRRDHDEQCIASGRGSPCQRIKPPSSVACERQRCQSSDERQNDSKADTAAEPDSRTRSQSSCTVAVRIQRAHPGARHPPPLAARLLRGAFGVSVRRVLHLDSGVLLCELLLRVAESLREQPLGRRREFKGSCGCPSSHAVVVAAVGALDAPALLSARHACALAVAVVLGAAEDGESWQRGNGAISGPRAAQRCRASRLPRMNIFTAAHQPLFLQVQEMVLREVLCLDCALSTSSADAWLFEHPRHEQSEEQ